MDVGAKHTQLDSSMSPVASARSRPVSGRPHTGAAAVDGPKDALDAEVSVVHSSSRPPSSRPLSGHPLRSSRSEVPAASGDVLDEAVASADLLLRSSRPATGHSRPATQHDKVHGDALDNAVRTSSQSVLTTSRPTTGKETRTSRQQQEGDSLDVEVLKPSISRPTSARLHSSSGHTS